MNEFLTLICDVMEHMKIGGFTKLRELEPELKRQYDVLDQQSQWDCLGGVAEAIKQNRKFQMLLFSYLLSALRDEKVEYFIENLLIEESTPLLSRINTIRQLWKAVFSFPMVTDEKRHYIIQNSIYIDLIAQIRKELNMKLQYVPFAQRNKKRVVLMIEPLLSEVHAPTQKMVNIYCWLQKLGYEVYVYATNMRQIEISEYWNWYNSLVDVCCYPETGRMELKLLGVHIKGYNLNYTEENYFEELKNAIHDIKEYNPAFILTVGDSNILADLCGNFTTVCAMACVNQLAQTASSVIVRYFRCTEEENRKYLEWTRSDQKIFEMVCVDELNANVESGVDRKDFGIAEDKFVILIAGNRLDTEVTEEVKRVFQTILEQNEVLFVFIGDCPKLENELAKEAEHYRFFGAVNDFKGIMRIGNLFLNPPRQGGGTGAFYAVEIDVPVLTLPDCDVAQVGEAFTCEKLWDMPEIVNRYIHDAAFMEQQKGNCRKSAAAIYGVDSLGNIKNFCKELQEYIIENENNREG